MPHPRRASTPSADPWTTLRDTFSRRWCRVSAGVFVIFAAVFLTYWPSINGKFLMDDDNLLTENNLVSSSNGLYRIWFTKDAPDYWPVSNSSLWLEWRLWGNQPWGYHVTNDLLHVAACLCLWLVLYRLSIPGAFLAALLFAVHPVNVESIAWIAQRKDALAAVFFLLSVFGFAEAETRVADRRSWNDRFYPPGTLGWHLFSVFMFLMALLSKGSALILPAVLVIVIFWLRRPNWRDAVRLAPFFILAIVLTLVNIWFQTHGGPPIRNFHPLDRLLQAGAVTWFYLYKALWPFDLCYGYPLWQLDWRKPLWWLPTIAAVLFTITLWVLSRKRRAWGRPLLFTWLFFLAGLFPVMGFTDIAYMRFSMVADHYQHIALMGVVTLIAAGFAVWYKHSQGLWRLLTVTASLGIVAVFSVHCFAEASLYKDAKTLYGAAIAKNPSCAVLHNELGRIETRQHHLAEATRHFIHALQSWPDYAEAYNNLAVVLNELDQKDDALRYFQKALEVGGEYTQARMSLATTLIRQGKLPQAIEQYQAILKKYPQYAQVRLLCSEALIAIGKTEEGIAVLTGIRKYHMDNVASENATGLTFFRLNRLDDAIDAFKRAVAFDPNFGVAHLNLALIYRRLERTADAIREFQEAIRCAPDKRETIEAYRALAEIYVKENRLDDSLPLAKKAVALARANKDEKTAAELEIWIKTCQHAK